MRVNRESLPQQGQNQPGKAIEPCRSCVFAGGRCATNRSFADLILNNTPPALGDQNLLRLNLVSRKTHFCSRLSKGDPFVTGTRTRQPQSVFATQLPSEMSPKRPFPRTIPQVLTFSRRIRNGFQPCSSTTANVLGYVRSLLNHRQEKKRQNRGNWHVFSPAARSQTGGRCHIIGHTLSAIAVLGVARRRVAGRSGGRPKAEQGHKFAENSLCTRGKRVIIVAFKRVFVDWLINGWLRRRHVWAFTLGDNKA